MLTALSLPSSSSSFPVSVPGYSPLRCSVGKKGHRSCEPTAHGCSCSIGQCYTAWRCQPSQLCKSAKATLTTTLPKASILLFLTFNASLVRNKYRYKPQKAYRRELNRIKLFAASARRVQTTLDINVVVAGDRNQTAEAKLRDQHGIGIIATDYVHPPEWASPYHRQTFNKLQALRLTQYDRVIVVDNDSVLLGNIDHLASLPAEETPAAVWHNTFLGTFQQGERCAVTTGLMVFAPARAAYDKALRHLQTGMTYSKARYDGGDQEFWQSYNQLYHPRGMFELPIRCATQARNSATPQHCANSVSCARATGTTLTMASG